jgi:hypothetical protein
MLTVTNEKEDRELILSNGSRAIDEHGSQIDVAEIRFAGETHTILVRETVVTGVPNSFSLSFRDVPEHVARLALLEIAAQAPTGGGGFAGGNRGFRVQLRDISVHGE